MDRTSLHLYRCHKEVRAAQIIDVQVVSTLPQGEQDDAMPVEVGLRLGLENGQHVTIDPTIYARHRPAIGDYYVIYDGGYPSLSPKVPFEAGYTLVHANKEAQDLMLAGAAAERAAVNLRSPT